MTVEVPNISIWGYEDFEEVISIASFGYFLDIEVPDIINYCDIARSRLVEQFKSSIDLQGLICVLLSEVQNLEVVFQDLLVNRAVNTAVGVQLEKLADIVGAVIDGLTESDARTQIRYQVSLNVSNGEPETVIQFTKQATDSTFVQYKEIHPAKVYLFFDGSTIPISLFKIIKDLIPAGVGLELVSSFGETTPFAYAPEGGIPDPNGDGFGEINNPSIGGPISEKIS